MTASTSCSGPVLLGGIDRLTPRPHGKAVRRVGTRLISGSRDGRHARLGDLRQQLLAVDLLVSIDPDTDRRPRQTGKPMASGEVRSIRTAPLAQRLVLVSMVRGSLSSISIVCGPAGSVISQPTRALVSRSPRLAQSGASLVLAEQVDVVGHVPVGS